MPLSKRTLPLVLTVSVLTGCVADGGEKPDRQLSHVSQDDKCLLFAGSLPDNLGIELRRKIEIFIRNLEEKIGIPLLDGTSGKILNISIDSVYNLTLVSGEFDQRLALNIREAEALLDSFEDGLKEDEGDILNTSSYLKGEITKLRSQIFLLKRAHESHLIVSQCVSTAGYAQDFSGVFVSNPNNETLIEHELLHVGKLGHIDGDRQELADFIRNYGCDYDGILKVLQATCGTNIMCSVNIGGTDLNRQQVDQLQNIAKQCRS